MLGIFPLFYSICFQAKESLTVRQSKPKTLAKPIPDLVVSIWGQGERHGVWGQK